jgi:hypothetical protein
MLARNPKFADSPLEGDGFELLVRAWVGPVNAAGTGTAAPVCRRSPIVHRDAQDHPFQNGPEVVVDGDLVDWFAPDNGVDFDPGRKRLVAPTG